MRHASDMRGSSSGTRHSTKRGQWGGRGQAMVEYLIIVPMLLMLVMGAIQFAMLYQIKSTLNYATFMAARQGALKNAKVNAIKDGLAAGMTPLFTVFAIPPQTDPTPALALLRGRTIAMVEVFNPMTTQIEVLSPVDAAYADFDPDGAGKTIPNDNLTYRCVGEKPCVADVGKTSKITIQDANILKIRVTYCAQLIVPLANATIYALANGIEGTKTLATEMFSTAPKIAKTPNYCSQLKDKFAKPVASITAALQGVTDAAKVVGVTVDTTSLQSGLNSLVSELSKKVAGLHLPSPFNWNLGGYRIPVTAEAVIRMQSPAIKS